MPALRLTERETERLTDDLVKKLGGQIVRLSQYRPSKVQLGLPDRRYRLWGLAFFFELKAEHGKLSRQQAEFLLAELKAGAFAACGGVSEIQELYTGWKRHYDPDAFLRDCTRIVERWLAKGYRK